MNQKYQNQVMSATDKVHGSALFFPTSLECALAVRGIDDRLKFTQFNKNC